jgi:hypothetical protein
MPHQHKEMPDACFNCRVKLWREAVGRVSQCKSCSCATLLPCVAPPMRKASLLRPDPLANE